MPNRAAALADALLAARRSGRAATGLIAPTDLSEAMAAQSLVAKALDDPAGGWKVAVNSDFGPILAPLHAGLMRTSPARWTWSDGLKLELEVAVRLERDLEPGDASLERLRSAISAVTVGVELVRRRVPADAPFLLVLADHLANEGYVEGTSLDPGWLDAGADALRERRCRVSQSGRTLYDEPLARDVETLLTPLAAQASAGDASLGFRARDLVTLGSVCGLIPIAASGEITAEIEGLGEVMIVVEPAA